jgi:mercuric ion transport protein
MSVNEAVSAQNAPGQVPAASEKSKCGVAAFGAVAGLGALAASSCCVLPLVLGGLGAGVEVFSFLEALAPLRVPLLVGSAAGICVGWWLYMREPNGSCSSECEPSHRPRAAIVMLSIGTAFLAAACAWGYIEPFLFKILRSHLT